MMEQRLMQEEKEALSMVWRRRESGR